MDKLFHSAQTDRASENNKKASLISNKDSYLEISEAVYVSEYKLQIFFSNGQDRIVDFEPFLVKSKNPHIRKFLNLDIFRQYQLQYGDLIWNDYELCFPVNDLYEGRI